MGTRRERVVLILDDKYTAGMLKAAAATAMLNRELKDVDPQLVAFSRAASNMAQRDLPNMTRSVDRASSSIDQYSGRLGLAARAIGAFGPAAIPVLTATAAAAAGLAGQMSALALGGAVVMTAVGGVAEAVGFLNTARLEPTAENLAKANEQLALLEPSARRSAKALSDFLFKWEDVKDASQQSFFHGFTGDLQVFDDLLPQVERIFADVADVAGDMLGKGMRDLASEEWAPFFDFLENRAAPALETTLATIGNFTKGAAELAMAMSPLSQDVGGGLLGMSEQFEAWAEGVSQTEGYREFIDYVRETGPQVVETLGSLADAALQIGEAAAPLGGPVLKALEGLADAVALIADSPLGPPIMAAVTAMSALSLATKAFGTVVATSWAQAARGQSGYIAQLGAAQKALGAGALIGGAAAANAAGIDTTYTILGAMAGSAIPGVGTAAGAATGAVVDFGMAMRQAGEAAKEFDEALNSGDANQIRDALEKKKAALKDMEGSVSSWVRDLFNPTGGDPTLARTKDKVASGSDALAAALEAEAEAAGYASAAQREHSNALHEVAGSLLAAYDAAFAYEDALRRMREETRGVTGAFTKNGDLVHNLTEQQQEAAEALLDTGKAWAELTEAERKARGGTKANRAEWVKTAIQLGWGADEAKRYADKLFNIPPNRKTEVELKIAEARARLAEFVTLLGQVRSKSITVNATVRQSGLAAANMDYLHNYLGQDNPADGGTIPLGGGAPRHAAWGTTVPKDGKPYADRYPYLLAPGEEVISNRFGQADRHRPLLKAINAGAFADGATPERLSQAYRSRDRGNGSASVVAKVHVTVSGEMDLDRATAQIRQIAHEVSVDNDHDHDQWKQHQGR